jgi:enoyl-CoA hydratase/carnithine racemase
MADKPLLIEGRDGLEIATLNRPDRLNAMDPALVDALTHYLEGLQSRPEVRVLLLRGAGRAFSAGLDLHAWPLGQDGPGRMQRDLAMQRRFARLIRLMRACPQPIVALGQGPACGVGFALMLAADLRYGTPQLRMNVANIKIGLGGADVGISYFLPRLIGRTVASELMLTGRFIDAARALAVGLINGIVEEADLLDAGLAIGAEMLATAPAGLRLTKEAIDFNADAVSLDAALALEGRQQVMLLGTDDHREAITAHLEKRPARFQDR